MYPDQFAARVRIAHADAWEVEGRARIPYGGAWARFRDVRLMGSGIARAKWNNADITGADPDLDRVADWYAERDVPWGIRVPLEFDVSLGSHLFVKRCVGIPADAFHDPGSESRVRRGDVTELELIATLDAIGTDLLDESRAWIAPQLRTPGFAHLVAELGGRPVGVATTVRSNGDAGSAAYVTGVFVSDESVFDALVGTAIAGAFSAGADLVHAKSGRRRRGRAVPRAWRSRGSRVRGPPHPTGLTPSRGTHVVLGNETFVNPTRPGTMRRK